MTVLPRLAAIVLVLFATVAVARAQNGPVGEWDFTTVSPVGTTTSLLVISQEGDKVVAVGKSPNGERPYDSIKVDGKDITLVITIQYEGSPMTITYVGEIAKDGMGGNADFGGLATGTWSAVAHK
ncbi:MAG: hypothetical protein ABI665_12140 [Vicinamibacterales bacterium]